MANLCCCIKDLTFPFYVKMLKLGIEFWIGRSLFLEHWLTCKFLFHYVQSYMMISDSAFQWHFAQYGYWFARWKLILLRMTKQLFCYRTKEQMCLCAVTKLLFISVHTHWVWKYLFIFCLPFLCHNYMNYVFAWHWILSKSRKDTLLWTLEILCICMQIEYDFRLL